MARYPDSNPDELPWRGIGIIIVGIIVFLVGLITIFHSFNNVGPNEVGVVESGSYIDKNATVLGPGWHTLTPYYDSLATVNTNQQSHNFSEINTQAGNQQTVIIDGVISYHVDPKYAAEFVIQTGGQDDPSILINRILWPAFQDYIREAVYRYPDYATAKQHQGDIRTEVTLRLKGKTDPYGLFVDDLFLAKFVPDQGYQASVDAAAKAAQDRVTAQNEAAAAVARANGQRDSNAALQQSLTPLVLQQQELANEKAAIDKWDGKTPVYWGGNGSLPFINIGPSPKQ